jgi:MFS family permease
MPREAARENKSSDSTVEALTRPPLSRMFKALSNSNYRLFWIGQLISLVGTWMQSVALSWLVLNLTHSAFALGTVTTVQFLPILLFTLFGGVLADRFPKRRLLMATQSIMAMQAATLAVLTFTGNTSLPAIYGLALVLGLANAVDTPTRQAFVVEMVGHADLPNAVALNSTEFNLARLMGPAIGGFTIAAFGVQGCFAINAVSYVAVIGSLIAMRPDRLFDAPDRTEGRAIKLVGEGIRYALNTPQITLIVIIIGVLGTFGYNFNTFLPLIAQFVLHTDAVGFGVLTSAMGVGALVAALGIAYTGRATRRSLLVGSVGFCVVLFALGLSGWWPITATLLVLMGFTSIVTAATANTRIQLITPPHLRGRVMGIYSLLFLGTTPIGAFVTGVLADRQGVQIALMELAGICFVGVVWAVIYSRRSHEVGKVFP